MAITRAQQAKQLLANGGRIGYRGGADMGAVGTEKNISGAIGSGSNEKISASDARDTNIDRAREVYQANQTLKLLEEDKAQEPFETLVIKDSNFPGLIGMGLDALKGPRQFMLNKNVDYFRGLKSRGKLDKPRYSLTAQGYKNYMTDRLAGTIDAAGNPLNQDDDDNNIILPMDTTFTQAPSDMDQGTDTTEEDEGLRLAFRADGGPIGGEFDFETARQMYGLGKLVKKITRTVKKVAKSPIGKAALLGATAFGIPGTGIGGLFGRASFGGAAQGLFGTKGIGPLFTNLMGGKISPNIVDEVALTGRKNIFQKALGLVKDNPFGAITAASAVAGALTPEQEAEAQRISDETGIDIEEVRNSILAARREQYAMDARARGFKADGGLMRLGYQEGSKEPVAKKTMPLLDMGGKEMDLREDGGFVPIGRMEKADDVPARLSKNEFVFTADAVRNAGDGDVDKGAEVMYNMMKNLEAGGEVSEESQGLEGARNMFQTSKRLEEVI